VSDDLEPLSPEDGVDRFLQHREPSVRKSTLQNARTRLRYFLEWCEQANVDNLNTLSGRKLQRYRLWLGDKDDLNALTTKNQLSGFRVFLKWAGSVEAVPEDIYTKLMIPRVRRSERSSEQILEAEQAKEILEYLARYRYASIEHVLLALLWETGMRIGGTNSLDTDDIDSANKSIELVHRPDQETTLKNGKSGERPIAITTELTTLLDEYVTTHRHDVTDDYGRDPLLTTRNGRINKNTLRRMIYKVTAPCFRDDPCPDCESTS